MPIYFELPRIRGQPLQQTQKLNYFLCSEVLLNTSYSSSLKFIHLIKI